MSVGSSNTLHNVIVYVRKTKLLSVLFFGLTRFLTDRYAVIN